ncbi:MAG TPA: hypothetical protein VFD78_02535 [Chitinophagaceae bacterium]|nr:hypothetical protein [Chitinophagaceae bacterium]
MNLLNKYFFLLLGVSLIMSCENQGETSSENAPAIVLGDPATIVTEEDSQYLTNNIIDLKEREIIELPEKVAAAQQEESTEAVEEIKQVTFGPKVEDGFTIDFGDIQVSFSGIETKEFLKQDPKKTNGVSYLVTEGDLNNATLTITGAKNIAVRQRYQSQLAIVKNKEQLDLRQTPKYASGWETLENKAATNDIFQNVIKFPLTISFSKMNANALRNAVQKELRARRYSRAATNEWMKEARRGNNPQSAPYKVEMYSLQFQISGTDPASGQQVFKTINLEL